MLALLFVDFILLVGQIHSLSVTFSLAVAASQFVHYILLAINLKVYKFKFVSLDVITYQKTCYLLMVFIAIRDTSDVIFNYLVVCILIMIYSYLLNKANLNRNLIRYVAFILFSSFFWTAVENGYQMQHVEVKALFIFTNAITDFGYLCFLINLIAPYVIILLIFIILERAHRQNQKTFSESSFLLPFPVNILYLRNKFAKSDNSAERQSLELQSQFSEAQKKQSSAEVDAQQIEVGAQQLPEQCQTHDLPLLVAVKYMGVVYSLVIRISYRLKFFLLIFPNNYDAFEN